MAEWRLPELSPWRPRALRVPPDSWHAWLRLAIWQCRMGILLYIALLFGSQLILTAPASIVTVFDFTNCYGGPPVPQPCERIAYTTGGLSAAVSIWCGILLLAVAGWLVWELWTAVAPKPISDDFLKLLDDSFARDWRRPRTWPWTRLAWAYGFTALGAASALSVAMLISSVLSSSRPARTPAAHVETSQRFRLSR